MHLPIEILEKIFKYTDSITIILFQYNTNILSKYFVEKYTKDIYIDLDREIINNNINLFINKYKLPKYLQEYCFSKVISINEQEYCFSSKVNENENENENDLINTNMYSYNFKNIIERNKHNIDIYSSNIEEILDKKKIKECKKISKVDFIDKQIVFKQINFNDFIEKRNAESKLLNK